MNKVVPVDVVMFLLVAVCRGRFGALVVGGLEANSADLALLPGSPDEVAAARAPSGRLERLRSPGVIDPIGILQMRRGRRFGGQDPLNEPRLRNVS